MPRRRALIIVNPAAGRSRSSRRRLDRVVAALERRGCAVVLRRAGPTSGDVERLAREAEADFDIIVAAGGDGTLNAVVNGMAAAPRTVALLPLGTVNVLAREIGLPRDPERLADLIAAGPARPIWPGRVGDRLFLTMASSGFDAETVAAVNPRLKHHVGRLAFAWAILVCLWRYRRLRALRPGRRRRSPRRHGDCRERPVLRRLLGDRPAGQPCRADARSRAVSALRAACRLALSRRAAARQAAAAHGHHHLAVSRGVRCRPPKRSRCRPMARSSRVCRF